MNITLHVSYFFFIASDFARLPDTTIALAIAQFLVGLIPNETAQDLLLAIIEALTQEEFDYWENVRDEVMTVVGHYINEHNMNQVEVYQDDLITLMDRSQTPLFLAPVTVTVPKTEYELTAFSRIHSTSIFRQ